MPELPEVETVRRGLKDLIVGKEITAVSHDTAKSFPNDKSLVESFLLKASITDVRRRAKVLLIDLSTNYTLMVHLKMTGQLVYIKTDSSANSFEYNLDEKRDNGEKRINDTLNRVDEASSSKNAKSQVDQSTGLTEKLGDEMRWGAGHPNDSLVGKLPDRSTRVIFTFSDESKLFFNDQRKFGWVKLLPTNLISEEPFMQKVGPEPLSASFTPEVFIKRIRRRQNTTIKAALLDQTVLAGIGNIYADESLWGAKIHPATRVRNVNDDQLEKLHNELVSVLKLAIEKGGSTDRNYVNAEGKRGSYIDFARVFRREGMACPRCGARIEKSKVATRGTHTCPVCQKA